VERNRKAGQNPPRVVEPIEEEEMKFDFDCTHWNETHKCSKVSRDVEILYT